MVAETDFLLVISVAFRHGDIIFSEWSASELSGFYVFLENNSTDLRQNFFQNLERNTNVHYNLL